MFYLKARIYATEGSSPQYANINMTEENEVQEFIFDVII